MTRFIKGKHDKSNALTIIDNYRPIIQKET